MAYIGSFQNVASHINHDCPFQNCRTLPRVAGPSQNHCQTESERKVGKFQNSQDNPSHLSIYGSHQGGKQCSYSVITEGKGFWGNRNYYSVKGHILEGENRPQSWEWVHLTLPHIYFSLVKKIFKFSWSPVRVDCITWGVVCSIFPWRASPCSASSWWRVSPCFASSPCQVPASSTSSRVLLSCNSCSLAQS